MSTESKNPGLGAGRGHTEAGGQRCKIDPSTQCGMVLSALRRQPMSAAELQWELPIADARAVVRDLINKGYHIKKQKHPNPDLASRCRTMQRYHLVETE